MRSRSSSSSSSGCDEGSDGDISEMEEPTTSGIVALSVDLSGVASTKKITEDTEREHRVTTWQLSKPPKATHILWSEIG